MIEVVLENIHKRYPGSEEEAVRDFSLRVEKGELVSLLGPSGCGKTTTLKIIAGLLEPDQGNVRFDGQDVTRIPAEHREAVMVFQSHLLFPFLSVAENVGFGLKMQGDSKEEMRRRVTPMLQRMQLAGYEERRPSQLSGGQRQRVALARALVLEPKVLLLDEPLSNLDASLRDEMRELILSIKEELDLTIIFVTHDQEEAVLLADRIAVMFGGELQQYGRSEELYRRPASLAIAKFFGNSNTLPGRVSGTGVMTEAGDFRPVQAAGSFEEGARVTLLARPEEITLLPLEGPADDVAGANNPGGAAAPDSGGTSEGATLLPVRIIRHVYMGTHRRYLIELAGRHWTVVDRGRATPLAEGSGAVARIPADATWVVRG
ncbi:MAG: ABC transporter ATP-binding protein [Alkalispirochaetaceae bacterium]